MPIHEYQCRKCEEVVERIEGIHDAPMRKCPSCGGKVDQMISSSAFVLKGTGWYATDYGTRSHDDGNGNGKGSPWPSNGGLTVGERRLCPTPGRHTYGNEQGQANKRLSWRGSSGSAGKRFISISALRDDSRGQQFP